MTRLRWLPWTSPAPVAELAIVDPDPADLGTDLGLEARLGLPVQRRRWLRQPSAAATSAWRRLTARTADRARA
jgi:hypothetical protein